MALETSPQTGLALPQQRSRTKALIAMPLTPTVEKQTRQAITEESFASSFDFEDVCDGLPKWEPEYKSLSSSNADLSGLCEYLNRRECGVTEDQDNECR